MIWSSSRSSSFVLNSQESLLMYTRMVKCFLRSGIQNSTCMRILWLILVVLGMISARISVISLGRFF
jgi:hypothetical protein